MTLIVDCPSCQRKLRVPDDLMGMHVKCPSCGTNFTAGNSPAPAPVPAAAEAAAAAPDPTAPAPIPEAPAESIAPPESATLEHKICPGCHESIPIEARRCPSCGESLAGGDDDDRDPSHRFRRGIRRDTEPHRGALILVLGILSIVMGMGGILYGITALFVGLPLGITAWVLGSRDLQRIRRNEVDPQGEGMTQAGWICGIVGTGISALMGLCCGVGFIALIVASSLK